MFHTEIMAIVGAHTLSFRECHACGALDFFEEKDPTASRRWLAFMVNAFQMRFYPEGSKVRFDSCLLQDRARDWLKEVYFSLGGEAIKTMTWDEFVT